MVRFREIYLAYRIANSGSDYIAIREIVFEWADSYDNKAMTHSFRLLKPTRANIF